MLVAFIRKSASLEHPHLMIANIDGSNLRMLYEAVNYVNSMSWSPDSRRIAFLADGWVRTSNIGGDGRTRRIAEVHDDTADVETDDVAWSPNGSAIAFTDGGWVNGHWLGFPTLTLVAPDGSRRRELVTTTGSFAWSPTGDALAFANRGISIVSAGGGKLEHLVATPEGTVVTNLSWSPDGRSIVFESGENLDVVQLCRISADGNTLSELADCVPLFSGQEVSKDSRTLIFVQSTGTDCAHSPDNRIAAVPLTGGNVNELAEPGGSPQWLPG
jgi:Tol biopolymer transport system component